MSEHSKRAREGPSVSSLAAGVVLTSAAITAAIWTMSDWEVTSHHLAGAIGCVALAVLVFASTLARLVERQQARDRRYRERMARQRVRDENTGSWISPDGIRLTARRDPARGTWHVLDPVSRSEIEWSDPGQITAMLGELEAMGWARRGDPATRAVCARLGLGEPEPVEDRTVRLDYRPFRTEIERQAWMDAPTEVRRVD